MSAIRLAVTFAVVAALYARSVNAGDVEAPPEPTLIAHPIGGETYLSTSDIVVSGAIDSQSNVFIVRLKDAAGVICQEAGGDTAGDKSKGLWAIRLTLRRPWTAGKHQFEAHEVAGPRRSVQITIIDDERHRAAGRLGTISELSDEEVDRLPIVSFPEMNVRSTDTDKLNLSPTSKVTGQKEAARSLTLVPGKPFGLAGSIRLEQPPKFKFAPVVLQIVEARQSEEGEKIDVIVNEDFAEPEKTETGFQFAKPLNAPIVEGRYTLRALYRRSKLCETVVELKSGGK